jgi:hypothetical protein
MLVKNRDFALNIVGLEALRRRFSGCIIAGGGVFSFALKPTAPSHSTFGEFATDPARGLSLSS